jgi:hypothetical protein
MGVIEVGAELEGNHDLKLAVLLASDGTICRSKALVELGEAGIMVQRRNE